MNPQYPVPNSFIPIQSPNPNFSNPQFIWPPQSQYPVPNFPNSINSLNPNPNFSHPQFNWAPPPQNPVPDLPNSINPFNPNPNFHNPQINWAPPPPPQNPIPDLPNSLNALKTLIQSSNSTLESLSSIIPSLSRNSNSLIQCPSNPEHWVPSASLFPHSLSCPSPLDIGPVIEALQYPKTRKFDHTLIQGNKLVQPLDDPTSELCFSIDDYVDFDSNFFYQDCPGVVSSLNRDASKRMFTLPSVLSVECANFVGSGVKGSVGIEGSSVKFLPSEVWFVGREVEQWSDYPNEYSLSFCKAVLCVERVERDLSMWVIENSPRFGVIIDIPMMDHLCVLFRLCFKAMAREGAGSYGSFLKSDIDDENRTYNSRPPSFKCPVLVQVLRWLTSLLSILYGEINSRSLVIAMLRHLLTKAASYASLFPMGRKLDLAYGNEQITDLCRDRSSGKATENDGIDCTYESIFSTPIFVYQIAAAVAALHERSLLEERIRTLRIPSKLTPYQRVAEHAHFSKKADEERQKRPDYKPLIEHDGLLNQRQHDQGGNRPKTKEELLAEERDYKRRRMSYRGKKLKRSTKEVMRDIIEEYMEAITHTGGIGGSEKGDSERSVLMSTNSSALPSPSSKLNHGSRSDIQDNSRTLLDDDYNYHEAKPILASKRLEQHKKESYSHGHSDDRRTTGRDRRDRDYESRSPSKDRRDSRTREHRSHTRKQGDSENEHSKRNHSSSHRSSSMKIVSGRKDKRKLDSPDRQRWKRDKYGRSDSLDSVEINDRYDPSESTRNYDDEINNSNYTRPTS